MELRQYQDSDCGEIGRLFYETVHTVNAKDYTQEQLNAWAPPNTDFLEWGKLRLRHDVIVAVEDHSIIGFGSMDIATGYLDLLYVQKDSIGKGVGTAICDELEKRSQVNEITTYASITAKPFFEKRGYHVVRENEVERNGIILHNYFMTNRSNCEQ